MANLNPKHLEDLYNSTLSDETIAKYGIISLSEAEVRVKLNRNDIAGDGWLMQYPGSSFFKIKLDKPYGDRKYLSPAGMSQDLFVTFLAFEKHNDITIPYYFVEGEKKALSLEQLGYAAISVPGVWGWKSKGHSLEALNNLIIKDRSCYIVFDSDKYSNPHVLKAEYEFALALHRIDAKVGIVNLDKALGKGADDQIKCFLQKGNLDDFKKQYLEDPQSYEDYIAQNKEKEVSASKYTDLWNAEKLVELFGENFRWCQELKSWFVWNGKLWKKDPGGLYVEKFAKKMTKEMMKSQDKDLLKHARASQNKYSLVAMVELSKSENNILIETKEFNKDGFLLNCVNGIVDLRTGELLSHDCSKYITRMINIDYDPNAKCPKWDWFMNDIFDGSQNLVSYLHKAVGYSLTDSVREQCFFILYGSGRNGKNTFLDTIRGLLGDYACKAGVSTLMVKHNKDSGANEDIADLWGKRMVMASESDKTRTLSEGLIKELTGDKTVKARFLYGHLFEFNPTFKIFLQTNHKPKIRGTDEGIWSRPRLVPFTKFYPPEKRIPDLEEQLIRELPGILRWAVEGCLLWQKEGLGTTPEIDEATAQYKEEEDFTGNFLKECCSRIPGQQILSLKLYEAFKNYAKASGAHFTPDIKDFTHDLEARGLKKQVRTFGPEKGRMFWEEIFLVNENFASTGVGASTVEPGFDPSLDAEQ